MNALFENVHESWLECDLFCLWSKYIFIQSHTSNFFTEINWVNLILRHLVHSQYIRYLGLTESCRPKMQTKIQKKKKKNTKTKMYVRILVWQCSPINSAGQRQIKPSKFAARSHIPPFSQGQHSKKIWYRYIYEIKYVFSYTYMNEKWNNPTF